MLKNLQSTFITSLNSVRSAFETFKDFSIEEVGCARADKGRSKQVREVITSRRCDYQKIALLVVV